jgi:hypothetical protein
VCWWLSKIAFCPKKVGFCPLLKSKVGSEKPLFYAGSGAFCPKTHFFSLINVKKKFNNINNIEKKVGF